MRAGDGLGGFNPLIRPDLYGGPQRQRALRQTEQKQRRPEKEQSLPTIHRLWVQGRRLARFVRRFPLHRH